VRVVTATSESESRVDGVRTVPLAEVVERWAPVDALFSCLPHGVSGQRSVWAQDRGARVVDLSADLRLSSTAVYGLTEVARPSLGAAGLVANPGCYPTVTLLGLIPLASAGLIDTDRPIIVDAASGVSGAGRSPRRELLFGEVAEDFRAYGAGNTHRHLPEILAGLRPHAGDLDLVFTPHLLPVRRGILATMHVPVADGMDVTQVQRLFTNAYADEPFVRFLPHRLPTLRDVVHRNLVAIGVVPVAQVRRPMITVVAAIDNLTKGAAGQAVQNMNVMFGLPETQGLAC
jgi:N-acetyl-gamma-glutamyl-phosphate reductase